MASRAKKRVKILPAQLGDGDRLSRLPDDLIHKILSFLDTELAVQTSVLSKRWKLIWTTLPFLNIGEYEHSLAWETSRFISHVMKDRHPRSNISELRLCVSNDELGKGLLKFLGYAISHNVENLNLVLKCKHAPIKLSTLSSKLLKKLTLQVKLQDFSSEFDFCDLPALTTLHLKRPVLAGNHKLPYSCLTYLPALRTLCLDDWDLSFPPYHFSLPHLTTLRVSRSLHMPSLWKFPGLLTLELDDVNVLGESDFSKLVNLQNLTLTGVCFNGNSESQIYFPQLLNLDIRTRVSHSDHHFKLSTPKLCNFTSVGIFFISLEAPELENVYMKLQGWFGNMEWIYRKQYYRRFWYMLSQFHNAKNLTFDLESIKALSVISSELAGEPSPFHSLKYVKLPHEYNESTIYSAVRSYLLGGSSRGTIVTTFPRNTIPHSEVASMTAPNEVLQEPLAVPTKELDDTQYIHQTKSVNTINMNVQEEHVVEDSVGDADRVRDINPLVKETGKDRAGSSVGNRDFGLWRGHKVNSDFVSLLDRIMSKYPETFENCTKKNKNLCTMNLNMLCTSMIDFTKISMTEVDSEMLVEYRDVFAYFQNKGFNVSWVVRRLDYIEHLRFSKTLIPELYAIDCRIDDDKNKLQELQSCVNDAKIELENLQARVDAAKTKLQNVQTLRVEKLTEIEKAFGTMGTKLAVGFIGDDLLADPQL